MQHAGSQKVMMIETGGRRRCSSSAAGDEAFLAQQQQRPPPPLRRPALAEERPAPPASLRRRGPLRQIAIRLHSSPAHLLCCSGGTSSSRRGSSRGAVGDGVGDGREERRGRRPVESFDEQLHTRQASNKHTARQSQKKSHLLAASENGRNGRFLLLFESPSRRARLAVASRVHLLLGRQQRVAVRPARRAEPSLRERRARAR